MGAKTLAITGATGFVGRNLLNAALTHGCRLRLLVRDAMRLPRDLPADTSVVEGGLGDPEAVARVMYSADVAVHVAGVVQALNAETFMETNAEGTRDAVLTAMEAGVKKFVHVSSLAARKPDISAYANSKAASERVVRETAGEMAWVILRPPAVYGPGDRATLPLVRQLSGRTAVLTGTPEQKVSLIHVADLVQALLACALQPVPTGKVYELDDGRTGGYRLDELAKVAGSVTGHQVRCVFLPKPALKAAAIVCQAWAGLTRRSHILSQGKVRELYHPDWVVSGDRLEVTGCWAPEIEFAEGFEQTLGWYRAHGWLPPGRGGSKKQQSTDIGRTRA